MECKPQTMQDPLSHISPRELPSNLLSMRRTCSGPEHIVKHFVGLNLLRISKNLVDRVTAKGASNFASSLVAMAFIVKCPLMEAFSVTQGRMFLQIFVNAPPGAWKLCSWW